MKKGTWVIIALAFFSTELFSQSLKFRAVGEPSIKRGKTYEINWKGGVPDEPITVQLVNRKGKVSELNTYANTGSAFISIPGNLKIGMYTLKLISLKSGEITPSQEFKLKRKIPLAIQLSPLIIIPIVFITASQKEGTGVVYEPIAQPMTPP